MAHKLARQQGQAASVLRFSRNIMSPSNIFMLHMSRNFSLFCGPISLVLKQNKPKKKKNQTTTKIKNLPYCPVVAQLVGFHPVHQKVSGLIFGLLCIVSVHHTKLCRCQSAP